MSVEAANMGIIESVYLLQPCVNVTVDTAAMCVYVYLLIHTLKTAKRSYMDHTNCLPFSAPVSDTPTFHWYVHCVLRG